MIRKPSLRRRAALIAPFLLTISGQASGGQGGGEIGTIEIPTIQYGMVSLRDTGEVVPANLVFFAGAFANVQQATHNFAVFDLAAFEPGDVLAASFIIEIRAGYYVSPDPTETYTLFSYEGDTQALADLTPGPTAFADLGDGDVLGQAVISAALNNTTLEIPLSAEALAGLNSAAGGLWALGGKLISTRGDLSANEIVFALAIDRARHDFRLALTVTDPCYADVTTTGERNGVPDGLVDLSDFSFYLSSWRSGDAIADITTTSVCSIGNGGDGVDLSDFVCYLSEWSLGCP